MHADEGVQHPQEDHDGSHEVEQVDRLAAAAEPDEQGEDARRQERERRERRQLDLQNLSNGVARRQLTIVADPDRRERPADAAHVLQSDVQRPGRMRDLGARQADQQRLIGAVPLQIGVRLMDQLTVGIDRQRAVGLPARHIEIELAAVVGQGWDLQRKPGDARGDPLGRGFGCWRPERRWRVGHDHRSAAGLEIRRNGRRRRLVAHRIGDRHARGVDSLAAGARFDDEGDRQGQKSRQDPGRPWKPRACGHRRPRGDHGRGPRTPPPSWSAPPAWRRCGARRSARCCETRPSARRSRRTRSRG